MRYIVGYTQDDRGREAIALASAIARTQDAQLDLVHVLRSPSPTEASYGPERAFQEFLAAKADGWLDEALAMVGPGVSATKHIRYAGSFAEGLLEAAAEVDAGLIVVGAARNGLFKRFTIGAVANALLHASPVPVALAPSGYRPTSGITRMTCALGTREGAQALLEVAVDAAARRSVPLRLISLLTLDAENNTTKQGEEAAVQAQAHADAVLSTAVEGVASRTLVNAVLAQGGSIEEAIEKLDWDENEIVLIGSSRLAQNRRIFMGSTANKMLRALPVPMVVVPRDHRRLDDTAANRG